MSRRHRAEPREVLPDPVYGDLVLTKFMNYVMYEGKKSVAEQIVYGALETVEKKMKRPSIEAFHDALANVAPAIEVRSRRVGGATYQVPVEVNPSRRQALAVRWIINYSKARGEKTMAEKLAGEMMAAAKGEGNSVKKRDDTHKMAEANKAFAHFRW